MIPLFISAAVCVGIPVASGIYFCFYRNRDGTFFTFLIGAACFYISQPLIRIPLINILGKNNSWFMMLPYTNIVLYYLLLGFTAGLFEETARFIGMNLFCKNRTSWWNGIAFGLGHGGCEALWLFVIQVLPLIKQQQLGIGLVIGAWERIFTILVHIGLSFIVLYGIKVKKVRYLFLAIALHTIADFLIIIGNVWILEGLITLEGIIAIVLVLHCKEKSIWKEKIR